MAYIFKKYEELTIWDDFMFAKAMKNQKLCKRLLEVVLGTEIERIEYPEEQKNIHIRRDAKGVRLDVYVKGANTAYNVEMQVTNTHNLPRRSRFYQGMMDLDALEQGKDYEELPESYIIFICKFDLFKAQKCIYTFENRCAEDTRITLNDGVKHIFVNPFGKTEGMDDNLKNFLEYLKKGIATDAFTQDMEEEVLKVKNNEDWRVEYMTLEMREHERFKEGRAEGMEAGRAEGMKAGRAEGIKAGRAEGIKAGRAEGMKAGRADTLYVLIQKGIIQIEVAAAELNISPKEVEADMEKKGYRIPASV